MSASPRTAGDSPALLTDEETAAVRAYVCRCLTDKEAARRLGVSSATLINLCHRGRIKAATKARVMARLAELVAAEAAA